MKAIICTRYGSPEVLQLQEVEKPQPKDDQVLVRVCAASLNALDLNGMKGPLVMRVLSGSMREPKNKVLGADIAGRVEAVGREVTRLAPGDDVFGGIGAGGFAEYACVSAERLAKKPAGVSYEAAAASPVTGFTALQAVRDRAHVKPGQRVLVSGAAGGVGTMAARLAKAFGADVTAVCGAGHVDLLRSAGAHHVMDYTAQDFTRSAERYDVILAVNGYHPIWAHARALAPNGTYVVVGGALRQIAEVMALGKMLARDGRTLMFMGIAKVNASDLETLAQMLAAGQIAPVIEKCYSLGQVPEAMRYMAGGHVGGKLIVTMQA